MAITSFENIFTHIGGWGRFQIILFCINCYNSIVLALSYFGQFFMTLTPPHWCTPPSDFVDLASDLTSEQIKELVIPKDKDTGLYFSCVMYALNSSKLLSNKSHEDVEWPTIPCSNGWTYNYSLYYPTITSQLDWVCDNDWKPPLAQSLFFFGSLIGSPVLGWASDRWGRLPIILISNAVGGIVGIASAFSSSFTVFASLRFIIGLAFDTHFYALYILMIEYVPSGYRTIMSNVPIMFFLTAAMCAMPWIALYLSDWSTFTIIIHAVQCLCVFVVWFVPESARWLLGQGQVEKTVSILERAAKVNKRSLAKEVIEELKEFGESQVKCKEVQSSPLDLLKTPVLRRRFLILCVMWMVIMVAYDGHMRSTENIGTNVFVSFSLLGLVELPADFVTIILMEKIGRKHTAVHTLVLSGIACFLISAIPEANTMVILWLAVVGRFLITMSINVGQQYILEILPTVERASGSGIIHTLGSGAVFLSPYIVYLSKIGHYLPYTILGIVSIVGGAACVVLPETLNQTLPDSLLEGETFFKDQSFCFNPCGRNGLVDPREKSEPQIYTNQAMEMVQNSNASHCNDKASQ